MKTGEILLNISKKDLQSLANNYCKQEFNKLCPFAEILNESIEKEANIPVIEALSKNKDIVYLINNLAKPQSLLQLRVGGPGFKYNKISVNKTGDDTFISAIFDGEFYGIQYYDDVNALSNVLSTFIIDSDVFVESLSFPEKLNYESLILYLGIIDSYRYISYRNTMKHEYTSLLKITASEFTDLLKDSVQKFDVRWVLSNLMLMLPSVMKYEMKGNSKYYDELFELGFLLSVKDNNTNESSILLDAKSVELGTEFLELWYKSAGIQLSVLKDDVIETTPFTFLAVTSTSNHCFTFEGDTDILNYNNLDTESSVKLFQDFLNKLTFSPSNTNNVAANVSDNIKPRFCGKCGTKIISGAKFCSKCGNHV